jgi:catabolite regulation protein CreA
MIQLYRKGDTHEIRGVTCEVCNFDISMMNEMLKEGWVKDPAELVEASTEVVPEEKKATKKKVAKK